MNREILIKYKGNVNRKKSDFNKPFKKQLSILSPTLDELSLKHYTIVNSEGFIDLNIKHKTHSQEKS